MMWADVMAAVIAELEADPELEGVTIEEGREEFDAPSSESISWFQLSEEVLENTLEVPVQFDIIAADIYRVIAIERRLRRLHGETPKVIGGILMIAQIDDARGYPDAAPGFARRSVDFTFTPTRGSSI